MASIQGQFLSMYAPTRGRDKLSNDMIANSTLLACGGGGGGGLFLLIYGVLALGMLSGLFLLANLCLLFALRDGHLLRHGAATLTYALFGLAAYNQIKAGVANGYLWWLIGACALSPVVMGHFIWLVRLVRRERRALRLSGGLS
jgi:hypothetical protein